MDSAGVRTIQISPYMDPIRIGLSGDLPETTAAGGQVAPGYVPSPKCQWVRFHFSDTKWQWLLRKPGNYAAKVISGWVQSNGLVLVAFRDFGRLRCTDGSGECLETYYAVSPPAYGIEQLTWMTPQQLNTHYMYVHPPTVPYAWALWQKIFVDVSNRAAEFSDDAFVTINLVHNEIWIETQEVGQYPDER